MAHGVQASSTPSPTSPPAVSCSGLSASGRSSGRSRSRHAAPARPIRRPHRDRPARGRPQPPPDRVEARHPADARVGRSFAGGHGARRRLRLERQDLPKPVQGRLRHDRLALEWPEVLWPTRSTVVGGTAVNTRTAKPVRCAIYTRVSTDHGLEQDFNSLDAQHDAAQAYIRSQAHAGWTLIRSRYDDGGYSVVSTQRPALPRLVGGGRGRKVDGLLGYKGERAHPTIGGLGQHWALVDCHELS